MDFLLNDQQRAPGEKVRAFTKERITPHYQDSDRQGKFRPELIAELAARRAVRAPRVPWSTAGSGWTR